MSKSAQESRLPSPAPSAGFTFVLQPADFRDEAALVVRIPRGIRSKQKLLNVLADKLRFPAYFGRNWDALEECLGDLSWLPSGPSVVLVHEDLPFGPSSANRMTYLDILRGAIGSRSAGHRTVVVVLPETLREQIIPKETEQR